MNTDPANEIHIGKDRLKIPLCCIYPKVYSKGNSNDLLNPLTLLYNVKKEIHLGLYKRIAGCGGPGL